MSRKIVSKTYPTASLVVTQDPTEPLCRYRYSYVDPLPQFSQDLYPEPYEYDDTAEYPLLLTPDIKIADVANLPPLEDLVDIDSYRSLQNIKRQYNHPNYIEARNLVNPFETIGNSIFMNRAAIKLANVDAVYNVSNTFASFREMREDGKISFCDIAAGPGGFSNTYYFGFNC